MCAGCPCKLNQIRKNDNVKVHGNKEITILLWKNEYLCGNIKAKMKSQCEIILQNRRVVQLHRFGINIFERVSEEKLSVCKDTFGIESRN